MSKEFLFLEEILKNYISVFKNELKNISFYNFDKNILENLKIVIDKNKVYKIKDLCRIETDEKDNILLSPFDKLNINIIEKKIRDSFLNSSIVISGFNIKVVKSLFNNERRIEIEKIIKKKKELFKILIRNKRNLEIKKNENNYIKKKKIQEIVDFYNRELEIICNCKIKNI